MSLAINYEQFLAPETWQLILVNVSPKALCNVMRASSYMNSLASKQDLWAGMRVNMDMVRQNGLAQLYSIDRYKKITEMDFSTSPFTSEELERVFNEVPGSPLQNVNLNNNNLSQIPAQLLANTVAYLKTVHLDYFTRLTTPQCVKMLETSLSSTTLVKMNLSCVILSGVNPELLANAVGHLETVNLGATHLTTTQYVKMLETSLSSTTLVEMNLSGFNNLRFVDPELLATAICRLQKPDLRNTALTSQQCVKLMETSLSSTTLVDMNLSGVHNLMFVDPELLATAICRLQKPDLGYTDLTSQQCVKLMETSLISTTLVNMDLDGIDLSGVNPELLANAVGRLETVNLSYTGLTSQHCVWMLEKCLSSTSLVNMNLGWTNLSQVDPELLANAVSRLQTVSLKYTSLTSQHCVKLLETSLTSTTLVKVSLNRLDIEEVPTDLLARARLKYELVTD